MKVAIDEDELIMTDTIHRGMCTIGLAYRLFHDSHFAIDRDVYDRILLTGLHQGMGFPAAVAGEWYITKLI